MKVRDMMTTDVVTVGSTTPLKRVAELLIARRISGVPVIDEAGVVVGVLSEADFVAREGGEPQERQQHGWLDRFATDRDPRGDLEGLAARVAADLMSRPAITIGPDAQLREAAQIMAKRSVNRLPVVEDGRLVGIISRADVVRVFVRSDEEIRQQVAHALRAVDGLLVTGVHEGIVELSGTAASQALAMTVRSIVEHLDGVVAVDDRNVAWPTEAVAT